MTKGKKHTDVVHATKEGRMYIKSEDFFKQEKVINLIEKLENSTIIEHIKKNKSKLESA